MEHVQILYIHLVCKCKCHLNHFKGIISYPDISLISIPKMYVLKKFTHKIEGKLNNSCTVTTVRIIKCNALSFSKMNTNLPELSTPALFVYSRN